MRNFNQRPSKSQLLQIAMKRDTFNPPEGIRQVGWRPSDGGRYVL